MGRYALIIGNDKYTDPKLRKLKSPGSDSKALAKVLSDPAIGGFDEVVPIINESRSQNEAKIYDFLSKRKSDDLVLIYFSGHGVLDRKGHLFLAVNDTEVDRLRVTSIQSGFIADEMDNCFSKRKILILDCCHSGAFSRSGLKSGEIQSVTETTFQGNGFGRVVLTSSSATQFALEGDQIDENINLSLFTHYLVDGLKTGKADNDGNGHISLDEWYDYAYHCVLDRTPDQIPHKWTYQQQGDLLIAKNPFREKKAAELPAEPKPVPILISPNKITLSNGMELMRVPAGEFLMGSVGDNRQVHPNERPRTKVNFPYDYWMARFLVTNEQYNVYVKAQSAKHPVQNWEKNKDHPVLNVSGESALAYCQWLKNLLKDELPSGLVLRLPTEAEWEKAARGMDGREYPWGNIFDETKCNTSEGGPRPLGTTRVGAYSPQGDSPYGCADMAGNVWEWTQSLYKQYPYIANDGREDVSAPGSRVTRGGSFYGLGWSARCACRREYPVDLFEDKLGFRVVASLSPPESSATAVTMKEKGFLDWLTEALGG